MSNDVISTKLDVLVQKLDTISRLLAVLATAGKSQREKIAALSASGLGPKEIAGLIDTTPNTVSVVLSSIKRQHHKPNSAKAGGDE